MAWQADREGRNGPSMGLNHIGDACLCDAGTSRQNENAATPTRIREATNKRRIARVNVERPFVCCLRG